MKLLNTMLLVIFLGFLAVQFSAAIWLNEQIEECCFMTEEESEENAQKKIEGEVFMIALSDHNKVFSESINHYDHGYSFTSGATFDLIYNVPYSPPEF